MQTDLEPTAPTTIAPVRLVAPLRRLDRTWLSLRSEKLDPRRHPSVSGAVAVGWLLRSTEPAPLASLERMRLPRLLAAD